MDAVATTDTNTTVDTGTVSTGTQSQTPSQGAAPTVYDLADDSLVRVKGGKEPVKFADHVKGFQSQATKASQEAARLKRELEARDARIREFEQRQQLAARPQGQQPDVYDSLRQLPYLTGEDAVQVVQQIGQQIQQRDQVLLGALKQLQAVQRLVQGMHEKSATADFEGWIGKYLTDNGYSADYADIAKEIYLAYEGDNLRDEFPAIFAARIEGLRKAFEAERQAKLRAARPQPFVPGKGGNAGPSKPLQFKGNETSAEIADALFGTWDGDRT
jgi:hypothetical protein